MMRWWWSSCRTGRKGWWMDRFRLVLTTSPLYAGNLDQLTLGCQPVTYRYKYIKLSKLFFTMGSVVGYFRTSGVFLCWVNYLVLQFHFYWASRKHVLDAKLLLRLPPSKSLGNLGRSLIQMFFFSIEMVLPFKNIRNNLNLNFRIGSNTLLMLWLTYSPRCCIGKVFWFLLIGRGF
jgi:hypothetical protein